MIKIHNNKNNSFSNFFENYCKTQNERITTKISFSQIIQQQTIRVFVMLKFLRGEIVINVKSNIFRGSSILGRLVQET